MSEEMAPPQAIVGEATPGAHHVSGEPAVRPALELSVVVPTFNERANVPVLFGKLEQALAGMEWEVIYVDDHSPDGTSDAVRELARTHRRVRSIERVGRRGLASACIEGMMSSSAPYIAVMDADLQHDERVLPEMLRKIKEQELDVVIASRRVAGGSMGDFAKDRVKLSDMGTRMSRIVCRCDVTDPMSGFFVVEAEFLRATVPHLTGSGFKILLDLLSSSRVPPRTGEVPFRFRSRELGESKLDVNVEIEYLFLIVDKLIGGWVPTRFVLFMLVGALGVVVHLAVLTPIYVYRGHTFWKAQAMATLAAMAFNFVLNNIVTFRDRKLRGLKLVKGAITFFLACSLGAVMNVAFANLLIGHSVPWYVAGASGTAISSVWNYAVNTVLTWRRSRK